MIRAIAQVAGVNTSLTDEPEALVKLLKATADALGARSTDDVRPINPIIPCILIATTTFRFVFIIQLKFSVTAV